MRVSCLLLLSVVACRGDTKPGTGADSGAGGDDVGADAGGTTGDAGGTDAGPDDSGAVEGGPGLDLGCTEMTVDWELTPSWETGIWTWNVSVGRPYDTDRDGDVDLEDGVRLLRAGGEEDGTYFVEELPYRGEGTRLVEDLLWVPNTRLGDVDGEPGIEHVAAWSLAVEPGDELMVHGAAGTTRHILPDRDSDEIWLVDLDGDGSSEVAFARLAVTADSGDVVQDWTGATDTPHTVSADLDGDGRVELLTAAPGASGSNIGRLDPYGRVSAPCVTTAAEWSTVYFAVGDLDGDDDGEFVVATHDHLAVCDADGSLLRERDIELDQPSMVGLGDLDGDGDVEIVVTGVEREDATAGAPTLVFDHELTPLWDHVLGDWSPLSLADLDGDGDHEIVQVEQDTGVRILDGDGSVLATWALPSGVLTTSWHGQPVVADVDMDGLAELVVPLSETVVLDTAAGGFPAPGAAFGWTGLDHHPGLESADGIIDATAAWWRTPGHNAWQGHPTCVP